MKILLKLEELAMFLLSIYLFSLQDLAWWAFPALILVPDISMMGYAFNPKLGASIYNLGHHKGIAVCLFILGSVLQMPYLILAGVIFFGHSSLDRMLGYGLKYKDSFQHTHLGRIGKGSERKFNE